MKLEDKFNRAFRKAEVKTVDWNGGGFREAYCVFSFTHDKVKHSYKVSVHRSDDRLAVFGYGEKKDEEAIWFAIDSHTMIKIEFPLYADQQKLKLLRGNAMQTEQEVSEAVLGYKMALQEFQEAFYPR